MPANVRFGYGTPSQLAGQYDPHNPGLPYQAPQIAAPLASSLAGAGGGKYSGGPIYMFPNAEPTPAPTSTWDQYYVGDTSAPVRSTQAAPRAAAASSGGPDTRSLTDLISAIRSASQPYQPQQTPVVTSGANGGSPYDLAGENAAYASAKDKIGQSTAAAVRGLRNMLADTGSLGAGSGNAAIAGLYRSGVGQLADTTRQLAEQRAGRAFTAGQSDTDRTISQNQFNTGQVNAAAQSNSQTQLAKWSLLANLIQSGGLY